MPDLLSNSPAETRQLHASYKCTTFSQVATGIGITPFASILQSLMFKYWASKSVCPSCDYKWSRGFTESSDFKLKKVDFIWVNREQRAFEWFLQLLTQLEMEQVKL